MSAVTTWARRAVLPLAVILFVDLCLDWHRASVSVAGTLHVHADTSALSGWGLLAAIVTGALILWEGLRALGSTVTNGRPEVLSAALACSALVFTAIEFFSNSATVHVGWMVDVSAGVLLWPAYVGLVLAVVLALCGTVQAVGTTRAGSWLLHAGMS